MNIIKSLWIIFFSFVVLPEAQGIGAGAIKYSEDIAKKKALVAQKASEAAAKEEIKNENEALLKTFNMELTDKNIKVLNSLRAAGVKKPTVEHFALQKAGLGHRPSELIAAKALLEIKMPLTRDNVSAASLVSKMIDKGVRLTDDHIRAILKTNSNKGTQKALLKGINEGWVGGKIGSRPSVVEYVGDQYVRDIPLYRFFIIRYDASGEVLKRVGDTFKVRASDSGALKIGDYVLFKSIYAEKKKSNIYKFIDFEVSR